MNLAAIDAIIGVEKLKMIPSARDNRWMLNKQMQKETLLELSFKQPTNNPLWMSLYTNALPLYLYFWQVKYYFNLFAYPMFVPKKLIYFFDTSSQSTLSHACSAFDSVILYQCVDSVAIFMPKF